MLLFDKLAGFVGVVRNVVTKLVSKVPVLGGLWAKLPDDKQLHFTGGMCVSLLAGFLLVHFGLALWLHFLVTASVGVAKEVWDHFHPLTETCEVMDAVATTCGAVPAHLVLWLLFWLF